MREGGIYVCNWAAIDGEFTLQLRANPELRASGPDIEECMEEICLQILDWNGDGEAVIELFPPRRGKSFPGGAILFAQVGYNDSARALDYELLFEGGICPVCKFGIGARSDAALHLDSRPEGLICGIDGCYPILQIYEKEFVALLSDEELALFDVRPVYLNDEETAYVDLIAKNAVRTVGYKGADYPTSFHQSFRCGECGHEKFVVDADGIEHGTSFLDIEEIKNVTSTMIVVDDGWRRSPAFRLARWKQILDQTKRRGLSSNPLAVLDSGYAEQPVLQECREFDWVM